MHRIIFIFMMVLLPLQWSWAAAGSVCDHEVGDGHFGHHMHQHHDEDADDHEADALGNHPDCDACHGQGIGYVPMFLAISPTWAAHALAPDGGHYLPDPPVESFLRPPLALAA